MKAVGFSGTSVSYLSTSLDGIASLEEAVSSQQSSAEPDSE
jgi:hypothetical protein